MYKDELTDEQKAEFDTPLLQAFARSYLRFAHSSPCTAKRKLYKYFEPLHENELSENDILFGPDREKEYAGLIADFKACLIVRAFDKFFDEQHNQHWTSKTIPRLVLLKKWIT